MPSSGPPGWRQLPAPDPNAPRGVIYLLCFDRPFGHARHYVGWTEADGLSERLHAHDAGRGAKLTAAVRAAGIGWRLARIWENATRRDERWLKNLSSGTALCPYCSPRRSNRGPRIRAGDLSRRPVA